MKRQLNEIFKDERKKSLFILTVWIILFIVLFSLIGLYNTVTNKNINNSKNTESFPKEEIKELNILDKLNNLINSNYIYKYTLIQNEEKIILNGKKNNDIFIGYKENTDDIIKYKIENNVVYKININDEVEEYNDLTGSLNTDYIYLNKIKDLIIDLTPGINDDKYTFYLDDNIKIVFKTTENNIENIEVYSNEFYYMLEFMI